MKKKKTEDKALKSTQSQLFIWMNNGTQWMLNPMFPSILACNPKCTV